MAIGRAAIATTSRASAASTTINRRRAV
jgi:hypothetical protein